MIKLGIVGIAGRGKSHFTENEHLKVTAVCDINQTALDDLKKEMKNVRFFTDYARMLEEADIDAVAIGTPMQFHAEQSIAALEKDIHVLCEVTAATSIDECRKLVAAAQKSKAVYMMAENYTYTKESTMIRKLCKMGCFGERYYAEGEYLHELKLMAEKLTPWRRHYQMGIDGITYGTHSLGPILQWMDDRVVRVCCEAAGSHKTDDKGEKYCQDSPVMLCKTAKGGLIKIRIDLTSDRPHAMFNYQLQGTDGAYESGRGGGNKPLIWLRELSGKHRWIDIESIYNNDALAAKYLDKSWLEHEAEARKAGHGGGDYFIMKDFIDSINGTIPCPVGIHEAMDMTLPGLVSQESIKENGRWLDVPDSRQW